MGVSPRGNSGVGRRQSSASGGSSPAIYATSINLPDDVIVEASVAGVGAMGSAPAKPPLDGQPRSGQSASCSAEKDVPTAPPATGPSSLGVAEEVPGGSDISTDPEKKAGKERKHSTSSLAAGKVS